MSRILLTFALCLLIFNFASAQQAGDYTTRTITPAQAMQDADKAAGAISAQVHEDLNLSLWASESLVADPITLFIDDQGRAYYSRTTRQKNSEFDIRGHRDWMIRSIALRTVEDRRAFLHDELSPERSEQNKWLKDVNGDGSRDWRDLTIETEHVYRVEDTDGDGMADSGWRIIDDFNDEITDVAGAIMAHGDDFFVGVGPDMWRMNDTDGDGMMDTKTSISHGYAVHIGFSGHGMSGLIMGPDGRVYWGIGDIGFHGTDQTGKLWDYSNQGVIVRSNADGSDFEVFAAGVRNMHEFVFNEYGDLISVDNDGDHAGEHERLVHIVNGSDSGWRTNWQFGKYTDPKNNEYKVWMDEELYKPRWDGQAAYITPPVAAYHAGPTGMVYNPGTALSERWKNYYFVAEFRGSPANSHVYGFKLEPKGASFALESEETVIGGLLTTGLEFGPDGSLYAADWINGWGTNNQGRIWKLDVDDEQSTLRAEVQTLLAADFSDHKPHQLAELLKHADMRVRQKAQFELANRGREGAEAFSKIIQDKDNQLARIHGIWGLGQVARYGHRSAPSFASTLFTDEDPEIRAQTAKMFGDLRYADATADLIKLLEDPYPRAKFFAAEALGRIGASSAIDPIIAMLEANNDEDGYLRHAGSIALARIGEAKPVINLKNHTSRAVRIAAVVALRRMQQPGVAEFLMDEDEYIVAEAARAINDDHSITAALPALAETLDDERFTAEPLLRRAINAATRVGTQTEANRVAAFAQRSAAPAEMRAEALAALSVWTNPSVVDRVDGTYRGPAERNSEIANSAFAGIVESVFAAQEAEVRIAAIHAANQLKYADAQPKLTEMLSSDTHADVRIAALETLHEMKVDNLTELTQKALNDGDPSVRMAALSAIPDLNLSPERRVDMLASVFEAGSVKEQQYALDALGSMRDAGANTVLSGLLENLKAGTLNPAVHLDLSNAITRSGDADLSTALTLYRASQPSDDPLIKYSEALAGGDAERGERLFYRHAAAQCARCHNAGRGGGEVGPNLAHIGAEHTREELLIALVDPSDYVEPGYGLVTLTFADDTSVTGTLIHEDEQFLEIMSGDSEPVKMAKADIKKRVDAPSSMPAMGDILVKKDLRDLVEFLASLKSDN